MATKRTADSRDSYDDMVERKMLRLSHDGHALIREDVEFETCQLTEIIKVSLRYDIVFNEFVAVVSKETKNGEKSIGLGDVAMRGIVTKMPFVLSLVKRCKGKKNSKTMDIPVNILPIAENDQEYKPILFVKENGYRAGEIDIDIRKCMKKKEKGYSYTKDGVRLSITEAKFLSEELKRLLDVIKTNVKATNDLLQTVEVCLLRHKINEMWSNYGCEGCSEDDCSQKDHMGYGGCLAPWDHRVNEMWDSAVATIEDDEIIDIAEKLLEKTPSIKGIVRSAITPMERTSEDELRKLVNENELKENNELYATCMVILDKKYESE